MSRKPKRRENILPQAILPMEKSITKSSAGEFTIRYEVIQPFKYRGQWLKIGDPFIPSDGLFDDKIIKGAGMLVRRVESAMPKRKR